MIKTVIQWLALGLGFNLGQRVVDHYIDALVAMVPWLSFLS